MLYERCRAARPPSPLSSGCVFAIIEACTLCHDFLQKHRKNECRASVADIYAFFSSNLVGRHFIMSFRSIPEVDAGARGDEPEAGLDELGRFRRLRVYTAAFGVKNARYTTYPQS